jgi:hypothetical protein
VQVSLIMQGDRHDRASITIQQYLATISSGLTSWVLSECIPFRMITKTHSTKGAIDSRGI